MTLGQEYKIFDWFIIHFTENPGMAFGIEWGGVWGKYLLTGFRIVASVMIFIWLKNLNKQKVKPVSQVAVSLVFAGAVGNLIDSLFYGLIFNESLMQVATFLPQEGGYAGFMQGKVVDMLYFPIISGYLPQWLPFYGGDFFIFFRPIFNIADMAISVGIGLMLLYQKEIFKNEEDSKPKDLIHHDNPVEAK
jgi:signal peptidase II